MKEPMPPFTIPTILTVLTIHTLATATQQIASLETRLEAAVLKAVHADIRAIEARHDCGWAERRAREWQARGEEALTMLRVAVGMLDEMRARDPQKCE